MRCGQNDRAFLLTISVTHVITMHISSCNSVGGEMMGTNSPRVISALSFTLEPLANLTIKRAWMELNAVEDGPDLDQRIYPVQIEIVNNGNPVSSSLHVQLNEEHEVVISHLDQGKSIELELSSENE